MVEFPFPTRGAAIFMLHPLHVEVVANIKSRDEIFALLGSLGALWAILKYFDTQEKKYRIAIPDFYLIEKNRIVEIKAKYWYDEQNMNDKQTQYKILGFDFELILDGAPAGIQTPT